MDKKHESCDPGELGLESAKGRRRGWIHLSAWAVLIVAGIVAKRVFGLADMMVFFHLPAALFLVLAFNTLSRGYRQRFYSSLRARRPL